MSNLKRNWKTSIAGILGIVLAVYMYSTSGDTVQFAAIVITSLGLLASQDAN